MRLLPNHSKSIISIEKLTEYCLNEFHSFGKEKANVFKSALNLTASDAEIFEREDFKGLTENECIELHKDEFGRRFFSIDEDQ